MDRPHPDDVYVIVSQETGEILSAYQGCTKGRVRIGTTPSDPFSDYEYRPNFADGPDPGYRAARINGTWYPQAYIEWYFPEVDVDIFNHDWPEEDVVRGPKGPAAQTGIRLRQLRP